jgi:ATP-dependent DNA helicase RecG
MGISSKLIRSFQKRALKIFLNQIVEPLPEETRHNYNLMDIQNALSQIHFPDSDELAMEAKRRFVFEEMLLVQIHLLNLKNKLAKFKAPKILKDVEAMKEFVKELPFILTEAQRKAIWQMMQDIETGSPMNRLMEGDVGSGKTVVALAIAYLLIKNKFQVAFMAPTEVLAKQHFQTLIRLLKNFDMKIACITGDGVNIKDGFLEGKVTKEYLLESLNKKTP